MTIALSILLLLLFVMGFWIVKSTTVPTPFKVGSIVLFFLFCVVMATTMESSLGWATSNTKNIPETLTIRHVVIKEPNPRADFRGSIYLLLDIPIEDRNDAFLTKLLGTKPEQIEPRLFRVPYSRQLHETMQRDVIPKLQKGQVVRGKLAKVSREGNQNPQGEEGTNAMQRPGGSESLQTDYQFYELPPSYFSPKLFTPNGSTQLPQGLGPMLPFLDWATNSP